MGDSLARGFVLDDRSGQKKYFDLLFCQLAVVSCERSTRDHDANQSNNQRMNPGPERFPHGELPPKIGLNSTPCPRETQLQSLPPALKPEAVGPIRFFFTIPQRRTTLSLGFPIHRPLRLTFSPWRRL